MNGKTRLSLTALVLAGLLGCGGPAADPKASESAEPPAPGSQEAEKTVFDDMIQTEDRARDVEGVLQQSKKDLDTAIERDEDTGPSE
jgi:hypothetical protein